MKQSTFTGMHIYDQISYSKSELKDLNDAMIAVKDSIGKGTAYTLLNKQYELKQLELKNLHCTQYTIGG